jgi:S-formylglutathione hydrolase
MHFVAGIFLNLRRSAKPWADPLSARSAIACTRPSLFAVLILGILVMACKPSAVRAASDVTVVTIHSVALENNLLGDPPDQKVAIYLPAEYAQRSNQRFAVLYFLHGFDDTPVPEVGQVVQRIIDPLIAAHHLRPFIVVVPNGLNRFHGSFYTNSSVTGNWEDYVARDVVQFVDSHYRTLPNAEARGISGHSMGGYGALWLAFRHPDIFGSVYAMSPCCTALDADLGPGSDVWTRAAAFKSVSDLDSSLPRGTWSPTFARDLLPVVGVAMSAAFAPQPDAPPFFGDSPFRAGPRGEQQPDPHALAAFQTHILTTALPSLVQNALRLESIFIEYGAEDEFTHIPVGARTLSAAMAQAGIPHTLETYTGSHGSRAVERIRDSVLPWFSSHLVHE